MDLFILRVYATIDIYFEVRSNMGSECSVENDYELDEPVNSYSKEWNLFAARRKQDNFKATVFVHEKSRKEKKKNDARIAKAAQVIYDEFFFYC